ncbi:16582_t:CDS:2, partial [Acaulospora morrowiae]
FKVLEYRYDQNDTVDIVTTRLVITESLDMDYEWLYLEEMQTCR